MKILLESYVYPNARIFTNASWLAFRLTNDLASGWDGMWFG